MDDKNISEDTYLQALALFTMAKRHFVEGRKFEVALAGLLGYDQSNAYLGHISDAVLEENASFDNALRNEGFTVPAPLTVRRAG